MKFQKVLAGVLTATLVLTCAACGTNTKNTKTTTTTTTADAADTTTLSDGETTTTTGTPVTDAGGATVTDAQGAVVTKAPSATATQGTNKVNGTTAPTTKANGKTTTTKKTSTKVTTTTQGQVSSRPATTTKPVSGLQYANIRNAYGTKAVSSAKTLSNSLYRLQHDKQLNVVYFGGSVSFGVGASDPDQYSWRALTGKWLKGQYSSAQINNYNATYSGTGTGYGVYRMERDVFSKCKKPDLVFIEFALNDAYQGYGDDETYTYLESIIRKLYAANPKVDIVLLTITDTINQNKPWATKICHQNIAKYYGLPIYDVGMEMYNAVQRGQGTWEEYIAPNDIVHLSNKGYAFYADAINNFLKGKFSASPANSYKDQVLPGEQYSKWNLITSSEMLNGDELKAKLATCSGWSARFKQLVATKKDSTFTYNFEGSGISIMTSYQSRQAGASFYIDGIKVTSIQTYSSGQGGINPMVVNNLVKGKHTLKVVNDNNWTFNIEYMFVNKS